MKYKIIASNSVIGLQDVTVEEETTLQQDISYIVLKLLFQGYENIDIEVKHNAQ